MKKIRVVMSIIFCAFLLFTFSDCAVLDIVNGIVDSTRERADALRKEYSETIIDAFKSNDGESIKNILCTKTQGISDIDKQIADGFAFIEGDITEYTVSPEISGEGTGVDHGVVTLYHCYGEIYKVKTDENKWYEMSFHMFYVTRYDDRKGITQIILRDTKNTNDYKADANCYDDDTYFYIGYGWQENYYYDSSVLAYNAIKAISNGDMVALKEIFSADALETDEIETQMQAAFDFFDGKATFGETQKRGETYYDGNHDFNLSVCTDKVIIENREEVSVYVDVYTVNIETDTGKVYEMEWAGYLKNDKEPNLKGIFYLKLIDGKNNVMVGVKPND